MPAVLLDSSIAAHAHFWDFINKLDSAYICFQLHILGELSPSNWKVQYLSILQWKPSPQSCKKPFVVSEGRRGEGITKIPFPNCHSAFVMAAESCTYSCLFWASLSGSSWHILLCFINNRVTKWLCIIYTSVLCNFHHPPTDTIQIQQHACLFIMHNFPSLRYTLQAMLSYTIFFPIY